MLKINYKKLLLKKNSIPITCLTAYSKPLANLLDGKVDLILIGDSLGTTLYGMKNTRSVTLEMMKRHGKAVVRNTESSMTIVDMPYKTYRNKKEARRDPVRASFFSHYRNSSTVSFTVSRNLPSFFCGFRE